MLSSNVSNKEVLNRFENFTIGSITSVIHPDLATSTSTFASFPQTIRKFASLGIQCIGTLIYANRLSTLRFLEFAHL